MVSFILFCADAPIELYIRHEVDNVRQEKEKIILGEPTEANPITRWWPWNFEHALQVRALSNMLQASKSMRAYRAEDGPLIMYSNEPSVEGDLGDGAGAPVFATLPIAIFGGWQELIEDTICYTKAFKLITAFNGLFEDISLYFLLFSVRLGRLLLTILLSESPEFLTVWALVYWCGQVFLAIEVWMFLNCEQKIWQRKL